MDFSGFLDFSKGFFGIFVHFKRILWIFQDFIEFSLFFKKDFRDFFVSRIGLSLILKEFFQDFLIFRLTDGRQLTGRPIDGCSEGIGPWSAPNSP